MSTQEAAKLGKELTCVGAEQAGNAEGTIPPYTGKYLGEVPGWKHVKFSGDQPVDFKPNTGTVKYADLLTPNHPNPDFMRYELRRVWVVEADLKEGFPMSMANVCCSSTKTPGTR